MNREEQKKSSTEAYVHSFYNGIESSSTAENIHLELNQLYEVLKDSDEEAAEEHLKKVLRYLSEATLEFLSGMDERATTEDILHAIEEFNELIESEESPINVTLTTAVPLSFDQRERIIRSFRKKTGDHHLFIHEEVDPSILGGVRLESENYYYDNTIAKKLEEMKDYLLKDQ